MLSICRQIRWRKQAMFHKQKHRGSQISGHGHNNHKLALEPFFWEFKSDRDRTAKGKDNPLFKISSLLSLLATKQHWDNVHMSWRENTTKMWPLKCWMASDGRPGLPKDFSGVQEGGKGSHSPLVEMFQLVFLSCTSKRREISTDLRDFSHQRVVFQGCSLGEFYSLFVHTM